MWPDRYKSFRVRVIVSGEEGLWVGFDRYLYLPCRPCRGESVASPGVAVVVPLVLFCRGESVRGSFRLAYYPVYHLSRLYARKRNRCGWRNVRMPWERTRGCWR